MDIIYCAGGNRALASIAMEEGFMYGARSDDLRRGLRCNGLIDIKWKKYDWRKHKFLVSEHRPKYAVVPDVESRDSLALAITLAEELKDYCHRVIIVPKIPGLVAGIPRDYLIGISVPTSYAGFLPSPLELSGHQVHLLGGTPGQQRQIWRYYGLMGISITSVDSNSHSKASDYGSYWNGTKWCDRDGLGKYEAFRLSCQGIMKMWRALGAI